MHRAFSTLWVRLVALVPGLLLLLPPNWCCVTGVWACCSIVAAAVVDEAPAAPSGCCGGCVAPETQKKPSAPCEKPGQSPAPCKSPCCERPHVVTASQEDLSAHFVVLPAIVAILLPIPSVSIENPTAFASSSPPPSIHVLHCRWMC